MGERMKQYSRLSLAVSTAARLSRTCASETATALRRASWSCCEIAPGCRRATGPLRRACRRAPARGDRGRATASGTSWRFLPSTVCEEAVSGRQPELRASVHQVRIRLDAADLRGERVPLGLEEIELRDGPGAIPLPRLGGGVARGLAPGARRTAAGDSGDHRVPFAVDGVAGREQRAELAGARRIRGGLLHPDVGEAA